MSKPRLVLLVMECDKISQSDYKYIVRFIDLFFSPLPHGLSIKPIFMKGKTCYKRERVIKEINTKIKMFDGECDVVYCVDFDAWRNESIVLLNEEIISFCRNSPFSCHSCKLIWFNADIEDIFLGKSISSKDKTKESERFYRHGKIANEKSQTFSSDDKEMKTNRRSNIFCVLSSIIKG